MPSDSPDPPRPPRGISAGEGLPVRLPQTGPDCGFVPGGHGVAGSNPAIPTRSISRSSTAAGHGHSSFGECPFGLSD
jgi:hypothetical protein